MTDWLYALISGCFGEVYGSENAADGGNGKLSEMRQEQVWLSEYATSIDIKREALTESDSFSIVQHEEACSAVIGEWQHSNRTHEADEQKAAVNALPLPINKVRKAQR